MPPKRLPPAVATVAVYYCPDGESREHARAATRVHVTAEDTFGELQANVEQFFSSTAPMQLRDEGGALYPASHLVFRHLRNENGVIRLVKIVAEQEEAEEEKVSEKGTEENLLAVLEHQHSKSHREPVLLELIIHGIFTAALLCTSYVTISTQWNYEVASVVQQAFLKSEYLPSKTFTDISTYPDLYAWMNTTLYQGLFDSDLDQSGSPLTYNRLVGGIEFQITSVKINIANASVEDEYNMANGMDDQDYVEYKYLNPMLTTSFTEYALNRTGGPKILPGQLNDVLNYIRAAELRTPATNADLNPPFTCGCYSTLKELRIRFTLYNANSELYVSSEFNAALSKGGALRPRSTMRVFPIVPPWSGVPPREEDIARTFRLLSTWLFIFFYTMVAVNTRTIVMAVYAAKQRTGKYRFFFMNGWNILQILSNLSNYANLGLRIWYSYLPRRRNLEPLKVTEYVDLSEVSALYSVINLASSWCIFASLVLFIHFFELAPKRSMWYVVSSTVTRASSSLTSAGVLASMFIYAFANVAYQTYGYRMHEFSNLWRSCTSMVQFLMGDDDIYRGMENNVQNIAALVFMISFFCCFYILILPLFIAMLSDAYVLRQQMRDELYEKPQSKQNRKRKKNSMLRIA